MKRFYALAAAALACVASANAQSEVTEDWEIVNPFEWSDYSGTEGVAIYGCTATVKAFALQVAGLPVSPSGGFTPVILGNGGVIKFFDNPEAIIPSEDTWSDADQELSDEQGWTWDDLAGYQGSNTALPFDFVIEGEGNEIHLDSYCTMGGTITGNGSVTIYCSNRDNLNFKTYNALNAANQLFVGTIYLKSLDGYNCDTVQIGSNFNPGWINNEVAANIQHHSSYTQSSVVFNIEGLNGGAGTLSFNYANPIIPPVEGTGHIYAQRYVEFVGNVDDNNPAIYNTTISSDPQYTTYSTEFYGKNIVFNQTVDIPCTYAYVRSAPEIYINSKEPSFSNCANGLSQRGTGKTGGTGWMDANYAPNGGRVNYLSAGYPYTAVGEMTWKNIYLYNSNVVRVDFAGNTSDVLNVTEQYHFNPGRNDFLLGFADDYFATATPGNYLVINAGPDCLDAGYSTINDTIGYEVWDNNGPAYVVRSVRGGETIVDAITGEERVAQPGDSIGAASFGNLAGTYGATCMDGNRPHYVIKTWGFGSYSDGKSVDAKYIGSEFEDYDGTYVINPDQIGTWARGAEGYLADSLAWEAVWEQFVADHPCSSSQEAVSTDDPSVIPGTVGDSVFVTYSYTSVMDNQNPHAWSWKNGSGCESATKGYPYAAAITQPYYYYSSNTFYINQSGTIKNAAGDSIANYDWSKTTLPAPRYASKIESGETDSLGNAIMINDPASAYTSWSTGKASVPQADGTTIRYWFNLKNIMTYGVISLCYEKVDAEGNIVETNAAADGSCTDEEIVNSDQKLDIKTILKESHAVASRAIYTLDGKRVNTYVKGLNIVTTKYTDGTIETKKVFVAE